MKPNSAKHNPDPAHIRQLIEATGLDPVFSYCLEAVGDRLGISYRTLWRYVSEDSGIECPYSVQYCLESLKRKQPKIDSYQAETDQFSTDTD